MNPPPVAEDIHDAMITWRVRFIECTHVVVSWDVARDLTEDKVTVGPLHVWGVPVIIAVDLPNGAWALGTTLPLDVERVRTAIRWPDLDPMPLVILIVAGILYVAGRTR